MKLVLKQRPFSWLDKYDIYDISMKPVYHVEGQLSWGHCLKIFNNSNTELGMVKQKLWTFMPVFEIYQNDRKIGSINKEFAWLEPKYNINFLNWHVKGNIFQWNYSIFDGNNNLVAVISKQYFQWTDTYVLDIINPKDTLYVLMFVIALDAEKCSRGD